MAIHEIRHPLIRHKLGLLRRADISTKNFRELAQEVTMLLTYEATKDLPIQMVYDTGEDLKAKLKGIITNNKFRR